MDELKIGESKTLIGSGLLGATGRTYEEAKEVRLREIERRILALEAALRLQPIKDLGMQRRD